MFSLRLVQLFLMLFLSGHVVAGVLLPPVNTNFESRSEIMWKCLGEAQLVSQHGGEYIGELDAILLKGNKTNHFIFQGTIGKLRPVVERDDGVLEGAKSVFDGLKSEEVSNLYTVCLLISGYKWDGSQESGIEELINLANTGNIQAQAGLGEIYYYGRSVDVNYTKAVNWLSKAADSNDKNSQFYLGMAYIEGKGVLEKYDTAKNYLTKASENGHEQASVILPRLEEIIENSQYDDDIDLTDRVDKAKKGDIEEQFNLATNYEKGYGVPQDIHKAIEWYKKSATSGHAKAMTHLGIIYDNGRGVDVDYHEAVKWYKMASEKDDNQAQFNLSLIYLYGRGVETNKHLAKDYMEKAASNGHRNAHVALSQVKWE